ncbi:hypothetical protein Tco_1381970, partial [Tanacetum coccineum]
IMNPQETEQVVAGDELWVPTAERVNKARQFPLQSYTNMFAGHLHRLGGLWQLASQMSICESSLAMTSSRKSELISVLIWMFRACFTERMLIIHL